MYVEIKLGGGVKASHIAVADNDIPSELAKSFCRIYALDSNAESILTEVVSNQMIQSGIPIGTSPSKSMKQKSKLSKDELYGSDSNQIPKNSRHFHEYEREYYEGSSESFTKYDTTHT